MENFKSNPIFTYRRLRRAIGHLGMGLPVILIILSSISFFKTDFQPSISHYYYTNLREIFTGTLMAVGFFLIRYKGYGNASFWKNDQILTNIAGIMAIVVAIIPVNPEFEHEKIHSLIPSTDAWVGWIHYGCASILFGVFSILALNVFTIGQEENKDIPMSSFNENNIYRFCGISIIILMLMVPVSEMLDWFHYSTLVLEAFALFLFGTAWLIKGRVLGDQGLIGQKVYREDNIRDTEKEGGGEMTPF